MKSIRFFLSIVILSTITLMAFLSALNGYQDSMSKAELLFDSELMDKAHLLSKAFSVHHKKNESNTHLLNLDRTDNSVNALASDISDKNSDDFFAFQIWQGDKLLLHSSLAPDKPIARFEAGFKDVNFLNHRWRVFSFYNDISDLWIITTERMDIRYVLAENIVLETILPVVLMIPFLGILIWSIISFGLSPLRNLAKELENKRADDLTPLAIDKQPVELIQVVNSTNDLFKRLKASFFREKRFASDAAHELRTPISAMKIHLHNLSHSVAKDEHSFIQLQDSIDRMGHLVEQILNLSRTSPDQYSTGFSRLNLYTIAQDVIVREYAYFEEKNLQIELEGDACYINGDTFAIDILLQNLISNARKYTPEGGSVLVTVTEEHNQINLMIEDSGPGVPEDQYARLFDRFYRLDGDCHSSGVIGCGLGLAIVQQIVELHHATISLQQSRFETGLLVKVVFNEVLK
ncbi:sensor histidine kinase [sulfur-oxidizing endosymbiont of Gigantopelta aegis]|uniref:sensor histidine kinase n=1 Tax=sulfur-oxidizing endosymbiont of Gigantopelta aegis TaxID=2794934 RepID=UPI0018DC33F4|nr:ATP-binding protein [sulfur-oxidizing endosymbiont of Gigantopelta aegis]